MSSIEIVLVGGPLHRQVLKASWIPGVNFFVDERERAIYVYMRDELTYFYDDELSKKATAKFDLVRGAFRKNPMVPVREIEKEPAP